jgi:hypothetical protein
VDVCLSNRASQVMRRIHASKINYDMLDSLRKTVSSSHIAVTTNKSVPIGKWSREQVSPTIYSILLC